jgi:peptidoglycan/LPS O-acetylase OafA/YrhL
VQVRGAHLRTSAPTSLPYLPQLDGLRAVAVAAVAWSHWERPYQFGMPFGAGVHLFYVLSGFLITTILLGSRESADRGAALGVFYVRRALRIFPAFYLTLAFAWWADVPPVRDTLWWHAFYASNVQVVLTGEWPGAISHFWSLAVEEQFYLVWPWLIVFAPRRLLVPAVVAAIVAAPLFRASLAALGYRETLLGVLTPGSFDSLGVGALLAVARRDPTTLGGWLDGTKLGKLTVLAGAGWIALLVREATGHALPLPLMAIKQTLQAVVFGWMVVGAAQGFTGVVGRVLSAGPVVYVGRISYGVYLAHGFAGAMLAAAGISSAAIPEPWRFLVLSGVTLGTAALSWHLVERPITALKSRVGLRSDARRGDQRSAVGYGHERLSASSSPGHLP